MPVCSTTMFHGQSLKLNISHSTEYENVCILINPSINNSNSLILCCEHLDVSADVSVLIKIMQVALFYVKFFKGPIFSCK